MVIGDYTVRALTRLLEALPGVEWVTCATLERLGLPFVWIEPGANEGLVVRAMSVTDVRLSPLRLGPPYVTVKVCGSRQDAARVAGRLQELLSWRCLGPRNVR